MRALLFLLCALVVSCGGAVTRGGDEGGGDVTSGGDENGGGDAQDLAAPRHLFTLAHAPVPGPHPSALVHLGAGFRKAGPLNLVVHYHGWVNCIANDGEGKGIACTHGGPVRIPHNLIAQLDRSGANAALVLIERSFDQANSDDGHLADEGFFRSMILELLPRIGELAGRVYAEADLGKIVLSSHSGGYRALAHTLERGGLTEHVTQVILLDSVYDNTAQFEAWAQAALGEARLAIVYTDHAGTLANTQQIADHASRWVHAAGLDARLLVDDRTQGTLPDPAFDAPLFFKRSGLSHDGTAQVYFGKLLAHAGLN